MPIKIANGCVIVVTLNRRSKYLYTYLSKSKYQYSLIVYTNSFITNDKVQLCIYNLLRSSIFNI